MIPDFTIRVPSGQRAAVAVHELHKSFGGARAVLCGVNLDVARGEYVAIVGDSGTGKSTLLHLIAGLDEPDAGRVFVDGADIFTLDDDARTLFRRRHIGFVFQAFHLLPHLTAAQNVGLPLALNGATAEETFRRSAEMLAAVGLADATGAYPRALSGGEQQRVAIARALVHRPQLVLVDEPTGNLDPESASQVLALLRDQVKQSGGAGILVTHSAAAAATADRIVVLDAGGLHAGRA